MLQSQLFSLAGLVGLVMNTVGMRILVGLLGETNMMRFGIGIYALEMVRPPACRKLQACTSKPGWAEYDEPADC